MGRRLQRRWVCGGCGREWVFCVGWEAGSACRLCGDARVELVEYVPVVAGADVRSTAEEWAGAERAGELRPAVERADLVRDRNEMIYRADPYAAQLAALLGVEAL